MKIRRFAIHGLLALLLLLSQQLGIAHVTAHLSSYTTSSTSHDKQLPVETLCAQCAAFASIGSALDSPSFSWFTELASGPDIVAGSTANRLPCLIRAFDSRAPPCTD